MAARILSVFSCFNFSRYEVAVNVTILNKAAEACSCSQTKKIKFFCPDYRLVSEISGLCLSVFVTSDQRMLWFTSRVSFVCLG